MQHMDVANNNKLTALKELTLSAWVKPSAVPPEEEYALFDKSSYGLQKEFRVSIIADDPKNGTMRLRLKLGSSDAVSAHRGWDLVWATPVPYVRAGSWSHLFITWNGTHASVYNDAKHCGSIAWTPTNGKSVLPSSGASFVVGAARNDDDETSSLINYFDGLLDEVQFWRTAEDPPLGSGWLAIGSAGYRKPVVVESTGLVGYWSFDEGRGMVAADGSRSADGSYLPVFGMLRPPPGSTAADAGAVKHQRFFQRRLAGSCGQLRGDS
jgi:hypothetical protein